MCSVNFSDGRENRVNISSLLELWKGLKKPERTRFRRQLKTDFGEESLVFKGYELLKQKHGQQSIDGDRITQQVFGKTNQVNAFVKLVQRLERLSYDFIIDTEIANNDLLRREILIQALKKRKTDHHFYKQARVQQAQLEDKKVSIQQLQDEWSLSDRQYFHQGAEHISVDKTLFYQANDKLETLYHLVKLRYFCEQENLRKITNLPERPGIQLDAPEAFLEKTEALGFDQPIFRLYSMILRNLREGFDLGQYESFKKEFVAYQMDLTKEDALVFVKYMLNESFRAFDAGDRTMKEEMTFWVDKLRGKELDLFRERISDSEFLNITTVYGISGRPNKIRECIKAYRDKLDPKYREDACALAKGQWLYYKGKLEDAATHFKVSFPKYRAKEMRYKLRIKSLLMRCYLEICLREWEKTEEFQRARDDMEKLLDREHTLNERYPISYGNFWESCSGMYFYRKNGIMSRVQRKKIVEQIKSYEYVMAKDWLLSMTTLLPV